MGKLEGVILSMKVAMKPVQKAKKKADPTFCTVTVTSGFTTPASISVSDTPFFKPGMVSTAALMGVVTKSMEDIPTASGNHAVLGKDALLSDVPDLQEEISGVQDD